jgi:hypothetical protein
MNKVRSIVPADVTVALSGCIRDAANSDASRQPLAFTSSRRDIHIRISHFHYVRVERVQFIKISISHL